MLEFSKYQGTGNDFIVADNRRENFRKETAFIAQLCERRFGIGADGLILLENPTAETEDFSMVYFNADGRESSMCGNGGRCIVKFAQDLGIVRNQAQFSAIDGLHEANIDGDVISLKMGDVTKINRLHQAYIIDSGSPHYITFVKNIDTLNVYAEGRKIRNSPEFREEGINVNFVETGDHSHAVRTYERGVEDETYSCGTGVTACALALYDSGNTHQTEVVLTTKGGKLKVKFTPNNDGFSAIWLTGPVQKTFEGRL